MSDEKSVRDTSDAPTVNRVTSDAEVALLRAKCHRLQTELDAAHERGWAPARTYRERAEKAEVRASGWGTCKHHPGAGPGCGECLRDVAARLSACLEASE